jgi:hypothetical protein
MLRAERESACVAALLARAKIRGRGWLSPLQRARHLWVVRTLEMHRGRPLRELFRPENLVNQNAGAGSNWAKGHYNKGWARILKNPPMLLRLL